MRIKKSKLIKTGDKIKVIAGNQKGFIGTIKSILFKKSQVIIEELLPRIKFQKSQKRELSIPIHFSNVMLWDQESNFSSRISSKIVNGEKVRYFKKSGNLLKQKLDSTFLTLVKP